MLLCEESNLGTFVNNSLPPWPSKIPKREKLRYVKGDMIILASYICFLHPELKKLYHTYELQHKNDLNWTFNMCALLVQEQNEKIPSFNVIIYVNHEKLNKKLGIYHLKKVLKGFNLILK